MIDLYFWPTPNGYKPLIFLEETSLDYTLCPINIMAGDQFQPDFLRIAPNNRIPAIVDGAVSVFESGAILLYLAEKTGQFLPADGIARYDAMQWLMWQMGGLGPMMGQANHFIKYANESIPYAKTRYFKETERLLGVLERQLDGRDYMIGDYGIADMASFPWVKQAAPLGIDLTTLPQVSAWMQRMGDRPAVQRAYDIGAPISANATMDDTAKAILFGTDKT